MLYKFKSQASADVILEASHAVQFLKIIGHSTDATGVIVVAKMPAAISALNAAIAAQEAARGAPHSGAAAAIDSGDMPLRHRAGPFLELLRVSSEAGKDVVWGV